MGETPPRLLPEQLSSRLVVGLVGPWPSAEEAAWLAEWHPAGVILFARNVSGFSQLRDLCSLLRRLAPGCEIMADHEGGPVSQLAAALGRPPAAWTLGTLDDPDLTRKVHRETARRLAQAGVDRVLAPCADVLSEPRNPVIGVRAFGKDPERVSRQVAAAVQGLRQGGALCCLKHWPGHGSSGQDSHLEAALAAEAHDDGPFLAGLAAGADALMIGHLALQAGGLSATLDAERLGRWRQVLEDAAGGPVLFFADDVTMGGLRPAMAQLGVHLTDGLSAGMVEPGDLPLAWLELLAEAGSDRLLVRGIPWRAFPLNSGNTAAELALPGGYPAGATGQAWPVGPYEEAHRRTLAGVDPAFRNRDLPLGWLDFTGGDRWEVAAGDDPRLRREFAQKLAAAFARVVDLSQLDADHIPPLKRLLVSSHRPLPESFLAPENWVDFLAPEGICLTLGHPGLAADLGRICGSGWVVSSCHEVDWEILSRVL